jgi:hypothetical protein
MPRIDCPMAKMIRRDGSSTIQFKTCMVSANYSPDDDLVPSDIGRAVTRLQVKRLSD